MIGGDDMRSRMLGMIGGRPHPWAAVAVALMAGGCSGLNANAVGILPTSSIQSVETTRAPSYPAVGVTPPAPAPQLTPAERDRLRNELEAARAQNRATAAAPLDQPLRR